MLVLSNCQHTTHSNLFLTDISGSIFLPTISMRCASTTPSLRSCRRSLTGFRPGFFFSWAFTHDTYATSCCWKHIVGSYATYKWQHVRYVTSHQSGEQMTSSTESNELNPFWTWFKSELKNKCIKNICICCYNRAYVFRQHP